MEEQCAPDNLCLFEFLSFALCWPRMQAALKEAVVSPEEKEHFMRLVLTEQSTEKKYPPLLIFHCALIALITFRLPCFLSIPSYKVMNLFL